HGLHHLSRCNHHTIAAATLVDDGFLQPRQFGITHLDAQIATRDHHHVRRIDDALEVGDSFVPLDFRNDARVPARVANQAARLLDIGRIASERYGDVINFLLRAELDVLPILVAQSGRGDSAALPIEPLAVGQLTADANLGFDPGAAHPSHLEHDLAVIEQQDVTVA